MRKTKTKEPYNLKQEDTIRKIGHIGSAESEPCQAAAPIQEQGKQILRESAEDWLKRKNISI